MALHPVFQSDANRLLLAGEARELIRAGSIAGLVWGVVCVVLAVAGLAEGSGGITELSLGSALVGAGLIGAWRPVPSLLLVQAGLNGGLLLWHGYAAVVAHRAGAEVAPTGLAITGLALIAFLVLHRWLGVMVLPPGGFDAQRWADVTKRCREALAVPDAEAVVFTDDLHRLVRSGADLILVSPSHRRDFIAAPGPLTAWLVDPQGRRLALRIEHPLGELLLQTNKTNTTKLRRLLAAE